MSIAFPNGRDDLLNFVIAIKPDEGYYRGGTFEFSFAVPTMYPHEPPKVRCERKVYHPNIDLDGNVCLNILREDWKPVLSISSVVFGLSLLFSEPNPDDPSEQGGGGGFGAHASEFRHERPARDAGRVRGPAPILTVPAMSGVRLADARRDTKTRHDAS